MKLQTGLPLVQLPLIHLICAGQRRGKVINFIILRKKFSAFWNDKPQIVQRFFLNKSLAYAIAAALLFNYKGR